MAGEDKVEMVAIIGAGIGGIYLAAQLGVTGFKLRLHDIDDARLADIRAFGASMSGESKAASPRSNSRPLICALRPTAPTSSSS